MTQIQNMGITSTTRHGFEIEGSCKGGLSCRSSRLEKSSTHSTLSPAFCAAALQRTGRLFTRHDRASAGAVGYIAAT